MKPIYLITQNFKIEHLTTIIRVFVYKCLTVLLLKYQCREKGLKKMFILL